MEKTVAEIAGERIRAAGANVGFLTDSAIAKKLGLSNQNFGHYARGERGGHFFQLLVKIHELLGISPNELLGIEDHSTEAPSSLNVELLTGCITSFNEVIKANNLACTPAVHARLVALLYDRCINRKISTPTELDMEEFMPFVRAALA